MRHSTRVAHVVSASAVEALIFFFFFQAEDGIRDLTVTGVQTCALPISYAHVLGLDVAVHDSVFVRIRERGGDLAQHANGMVDGQLAVPREANPQRLAVHERHREVRQAVRLARGEQRYDGRMLELGRTLALQTE